MPDSACSVNVIIPNWNGQKWLSACFDALSQQAFEAFDITLVDNGSTDGSPERVEREHPEVRVLRLDHNRGFAVAVNEGIAATQAEYVALLNSDTKADPNWLAELVSALESLPPEVGAVAPQMVVYGEEDVIENAGDILSWYGETLKRGRGHSASEFAEDCEVFSVCAGAALYRRTCLDAVGSFDADFFAYLEDVDFCLRARILGYRFRYVASARIAHHGHASGLHHAFYVRLVARNRLLLFVKNVPARLRWHHGSQFFYGQLYFFLVYRRPLAYVLGLFDAFKGLPRAHRHCRDLWSRACIDPQQLDAEIRETSAMKPIRTHLLEKMRGRPA